MVWVIIALGATFLACAAIDHADNDFDDDDDDDFVEISKNKNSGKK